MPSDSHCVFCRIVGGQIPCFKIYEDETILAFLDIGPLVHGHTLVIPRSHHSTIMETPPELLGAINERLPRIVRAVLGATGAKACHFLVNNGAEAQQSVGHLHYHILPRAPGDRFHIPWHAGTLEKNAGVALVESMKEILASS
jgi:histidine triad (HIT) family protein